MVVNIGSYEFISRCGVLRKGQRSCGFDLSKCPNPALLQVYWAVVASDGLGGCGEGWHSWSGTGRQEGSRFHEGAGMWKACSLCRVCLVENPDPLDRDVIHKVHTSPMMCLVVRPKQQGSCLAIDG
jgi:hypothetical protein